MKKLIITLLLTLSIANVNAQSFVDEITNIVGSSPDVNINLGTGLINTILAFSDDKDTKEARKILSGLDRIRVSIFELNGNKNSTKIAQRIKSEIDDLSAKGYEQIVSVRDGDDTVHIVAKVNNQNLEDAMIVAMEDDDELVIISLGGIVDLQHLAQITDRFDVDLGDVFDN